MTRPGGIFKNKRTGVEPRGRQSTWRDDTRRPPSIFAKARILTYSPQFIIGFRLEKVNKRPHSPPRNPHAFYRRSFVNASTMLKNPLIYKTREEGSEVEKVGRPLF